MDQRLLGQIFSILYRCGHPLHREEGGQVGGVGGDDDQGEEPPDAAHDPGGGRPGVEVGALLHQSPHGEPETVGEGEVVLDHVAGVHTGVRAGPLVGGEPGHYPDCEGDQEVGQQDVEPDL